MKHNNLSNKQKIIVLIIYIVVMCILSGFMIRMSISTMPFFASVPIIVLVMTMPFLYNILDNDNKSESEEQDNE